jgi:hypothetical protein
MIMATAVKKLEPRSRRLTSFASSQTGGLEHDVRHHFGVALLAIRHPLKWIEDQSVHRWRSWISALANAPLE